DPTQFFVAMRRIKDRRVLRDGELRVRFRATGHDALLLALARDNGVEELIELLPPVPYRAALEEMVRADGLLLLQAANCNEQIPAKLYEYVRSGRPIIALTDPDGDTAGALREAGIDTIARLDASEEIAALLGRFVVDVRENRAPVADPGYRARASR